MDGEEKKTIEEIRTRLGKYLDGKPYGFNRDAGIVDSILAGIAKRRLRFGGDYCPCRMVTGDKEKDAGIICPCVFHEEEIDKDGQCQCRLFTRS